MKFIYTLFILTLISSCGKKYIYAIPTSTSPVKIAKSQEELIKSNEEYTWDSYKNDADTLEFRTFMRAIDIQSNVESNKNIAELKEGLELIEKVIRLEKRIDFTMVYSYTLLFCSDAKEVTGELNLIRYDYPILKSDVSIKENIQAIYEDIDGEQKMFLDDKIPADLFRYKYCNVPSVKKSFDHYRVKKLVVNMYSQAIKNMFKERIETLEKSL